MGRAFLGEFEQRVMLAILRCEAKATPIEIRREVFRASGHEPSRGAFYTTLDRLDAKGLVRWTTEPGAAGRDGLLNAGDLVSGQIVHDDEVTRPQGRRQHLFDPGKEAFSVHRPVEKHWRDKAVERETADKGYGFPMSVRDCGPTAFALRRPAPQTGHLRRKAAFVDEDQAFGIKIGLAFEPGLAGRLYIGAFLLTGVSRLFLCVCWCRSRNFQTAVRTTVTPRISAKRSTISSSVVSGACLSVPKMKLACGSSTEPFGLPCLGGATLPVARFSRAQAPAVAMPIENRAAAARVDIPPSIAETTRSRKSMLYGLPIPSSRLRR